MVLTKKSLLLVGKPGHLRDALASLLGTVDDIDQITCADSGLLALKTIRNATPNVVLIAAGLPDPEVTELISQIKLSWPEIICLVLAEKSFLQQQAEYAGADLVLSGGIDSSHLIQAVSRAVNAA
ncbi:MAG: response regulator transcription factor [Chloroflexi bacterium]|nr:response regulator transcription factor [Chloroflexota bacterium]